MDNRRDGYAARPMYDCVATPRQIERSAAAAEPLHVFVIHDDPPAYHRAVQLLAHTLSRGSEPVELRPLPWTFRSLESPYWRRYASDDAQRAAIVMVSMSGAGALPAVVSAWIRSCCAAQRVAPALLVALLGRPGERSQAYEATREFLRRTAKSAGLAFLSPGETPMSEAVVA